MLYSHYDINNKHDTNLNGKNEFIYFYLQSLATRGERERKRDTNPKSVF